METVPMSRGGESAAGSGMSTKATGVAGEGNFSCDALIAACTKQRLDCASADAHFDFGAALICLLVCSHGKSLDMETIVPAACSDSRHACATGDSRPNTNISKVMRAMTASIRDDGFLMKK